MNAPTKAFEIRAPWWDEIPRLKSFLTNTLPLEGDVHLLVCVVPDPERMVGVAGLIPVAPVEGETPSPAPAFLRMRPRHRKSERSRALWTTVRQKAAALGLTRLRLQLDRGESEALGMPEQTQRVQSEELWQLELRKVWRRVEPLAARLPLPIDWIQRSPTPEDLPAIRTLAEHYRFRTGEEIFLRSDPPSAGRGGYDPRISNVILDSSGKLLAAVLCRSSAGITGHTELRMTAPDVMEHSSRLNLHLLADSLKKALAEGYVATTLTVNLGRDKETRRLAERSGGQLLQSTELWTLEV